jgi:GT2 family glycosyltransferase
MDNYPLVTVFTLIYNTNPRYVIEAIESIRANNYPNIQHIIIDDCSPDPTPKETVKQWIKENNYPCEFYEHDVNYGICKTLNHVLELAKGKYILGCSDDLLSPTRIGNDVKILESINENYALVFGMSQIMDSNSNLEFNVIPNLNNLPADDNYFNLLVHGNMISAPSVTMKTECLRVVGGYDEAIKYEDYDMWLKLSQKGFYFKANPIINSYYRIHKENISSSVNYVVEDFKCLVKHTQISQVKDLLYKKIYIAGFTDIELFQEIYPLYKVAIGADLKLTISGLKLHYRIKSLIIKTITFFE